MKILLVAERYYPEVGAATSRLQNMAEGLNKRGIEVNILTSLPNYPKGKIFEGYRHCISKREKIGECDVYRYWAYATISVNAVKRALNMLSFALSIWLFAFKRKKIRSYDKIIIQTPALFPATSAMILFKLLYRKKCILNVSDIWPLSAVDTGAMSEGSVGYKVMLWCEKFLYRKADAILGQSNEILKRVKELQPKKTMFLYRNLQNYEIREQARERHNPLRVAFAGLLGFAQDVYSIVENVDFKALGVEFHIAGGGNQYDTIEKYVQEHKDCNIVMHGFLQKKEMKAFYDTIDVSIVPLTSRIVGAFPSKIFDILPMGVPILYCGEGEGEEFVKQHKVGFTCKAKDFEGIKNNIIKVRDLSNEDFAKLSLNCIETTKNELDFAKQMQTLVKFLQ